jgi:hypothetical protein
LYFASWSRAKYTWNDPVRVLATGVSTAVRPEYSISLAQDPKNNVFGLLYVVGNGRIDLALSTDGGVTWKSQTVFSDPGAVRAPTLALYGGVVHLAFLHAGEGIIYLTGNQTDAASAWTSKVVPLPPGLDGFPRPALRIAVDSAGTPGIAYWLSPSSATSATLAFWRPAYDMAVKVTDTNGVSNNALGCDLGFDQVNPRIATMANRDTSKDPVWLSRSDDGGSTWQAPVTIPQDGSATQGGYVSLAIGAKGQGGILMEASGIQPDDAACDQPKLARSSNLLDWTTCSPKPQPSFVVDGEVPSLQAAYGRLVFGAVDSLYVAFLVNGSSLMLNQGVYVWREAIPLEYQPF